MSDNFCLSSRNQAERKMHRAISNSWFSLRPALATRDKLKFVAHLVLTVCSISIVHAQSASLKTYRGSLGDKHIEMRLTIGGSKVTGSYFYDRFKQDIPLEGTYDAKGQLELIEGAGKRKTGKFICKKESETPDIDLDCEWSRPDGTGKALVFLHEQGLRFTTETKVTPKLFTDRKGKVEASYPQMSASVLTPAMSEFNRLVELRVQETIKEFQPESYANAAFDTTYNVLFADDDRISVEMNEYSDVGGAHPNDYFWTLNYDLKANKKLTLDDVFKPDVEYKTAIAEFVAKDINRRADQMERDEARRNNRPPEKRDQPVMTVDQLPEMDNWGFSPKGLVVYFDFAHVMAVFSKTVVPYSVVARYLKPNSVVPLVR